jgi:ABC-type multidrug transport system fused ATPase/permease subunit
MLIALINGGIFPIYSILLGRILNVMGNPSDPNFIEKSNELCLLFLYLAILAFIVNFGQYFLMSYNGEALTYKLRKDLFAKYLRMPISFFD